MGAGGRAVELSRHRRETLMRPLPGSQKLFHGGLPSRTQVVYDRQDVGGVAQLGERRVRNAKVGSSILLLSTNEIPLKPAF